jgi:uncharacterized membrane protein
MPFCPKCGAQTEGTFCGQCGSAMGQAPAPAQGAGLTDNAAGALCYLAGFITGIIFLVLAPYNASPRVRFHAWQSIGFSVAVIIVNIVLSILTAVTAGILGLVLAPIGLLVWLAAVVLWIVLMLKTFQGSDMSLPVIGDFARKQAGM